MGRRQTTIFNQLILNIILPTLTALLIMAFLNFVNTKTIIINSNNEKNSIISSEITEVLKFQELAITIIEKSISNRMEFLSDKLVNQYLRDTKNIESIDLNRICNELGMSSETEDIYIIDPSGIIVNTTFKNDLGFNLFNLGEEHKKHLLHVFDTGVFINTRFAIEASTKKPRKYTYQATLDKKYVVELGVYSSEANDVLNTIENVKAHIIRENEGIMDLEIFFMADTIFSLNSKALFFSDKGDILHKTFINQDTIALYEKTGKQLYHYQYLYLPRINSQFYKGSVIRIVSDRTSEKVLLKRELTKFAVLFLLTLLIVAILIYRKTKIITQPIKKLVENVDRITGGHLSERADVIGNNEITKLSTKFNMMIDELEKYYNELEQMVKDRTAEIEKQKLEIEEQRRHIMDSIHYARRIQTAILPSDDFIKKSFSNHFIYYRPKDIVSGDFYWFHRNNNQIMISAVDCTGHGVPGAFMSIVGHNQLNHAVNVKKSKTTDELLNNLNKGVIETLSVDTHESKVMDGMDLALCLFSDKMDKLQFSGANNPLVFIRDNELIQYKGDKFPIGAYEGIKEQIFTRVDIDLKKGDCIYIYSDGYADQFGGTDDKKFATKKFRELLLSIHQKPMEEQKEILNSKLEEWMGDREQVDDILVIGIKI